MTTDQIAKADRLAEEWRTAHPLLDVGRGQLLRLTVPTDPSEEQPRRYNLGTFVDNARVG